MDNMFKRLVNSHREEVMRTKLLIALAVAGLQLTPTPAQDQKLLPGYYIYIGRQLGGGSPKYMTVGDDGSVRWQTSSRASMPASAGGGSKNGPTFDKPDNADPPSAAAQAQRSEFETYEYPFIKWKPKMLATGAIVQLETTFDTSGDNYGRRSYGTVKYKVHVLLKGNALIPGQGISVDLLDKRGFTLKSFTISSSSLSPIAGTSVMEGRGTSNLSEDEYQRAVDYSVK